MKIYGIRIVRQLNASKTLQINQDEHSKYIYKVLVYESENRVFFSKAKIQIWGFIIEYFIR